MSASLLLEVLTKAADYLKSKGVPNARLDADLLLAHVLGLKRLDLYLQFDRPLTPVELDAYRAFIRRRGAREPLQHIEGECVFRELRLKTDRRALIPRPETELILDALKKRLPAAASSMPVRVLDVGTGTGAIILSVARELPACETWACDISAACLDLTRENAARNGLAVPVLVESDLFSGFDKDQRWDAIVSNPPYIAAADAETLEPEVRDHDPRNALVGGTEGWELPASLLSDARERLSDGGIFLMEIDPSQFSRLSGLALNLGWNQVEGIPDYQHLNRFIAAKK
jgi:release factor glutamine methyltransferase